MALDLLGGGLADTSLRSPRHLGPLDPGYVLNRYVGGKSARQIAKELLGFYYCKRRTEPKCPSDCFCTTLSKIYRFISRWKQYGAPTGRALEILLDQEWSRKDPHKFQERDPDHPGFWKDTQEVVDREARREARKEKRVAQSAANAARMKEYRQHRKVEAATKRVDRWREKWLA